MNERIKASSTAIFKFILTVAILISSQMESAAQTGTKPDAEKLPAIQPFPNAPTSDFRPLQPINPQLIQVPPLDPSRLLSQPPKNFDLALIQGDWLADKPFNIRYHGGEAKVLGVTFTGFTADSKAQWVAEGVMYESLTQDGARQYPTSFNYRVTGNVLVLMVTFSASTHKNGSFLTLVILGVDNPGTSKAVLRLRNISVSGEVIELRAQ